MNILQFHRLKQQDNHVTWGGLVGSSLSLAINQLQAEGVKLVITPDIHSAYQLQQELLFFQPTGRISVFPDWEILPYDHFSAHEDIVSDRLLTLNELSQGTTQTIITAISTLMHYLAPPSHTLAQTFILRCGDTLKLDPFRERLIKAGYHSTHTVWHHGEFAIRGSIIDVFPMGSSRPMRIELFDDSIESLRTFHVDTQTTIEKVTSMHLLPATEFPLNEGSIDKFRAAWRHTFTNSPMESPIYKAISQGQSIAGIEYFIPLFFDNMSTLFDYLPANTTCLLIGDIDSSIKDHYHDITQRYEQYRHDTQRPLLPPQRLFLNTTQIFTLLKRYPKVSLQHNHIKQKSGKINFPASALPPLQINHQQAKPLQRLHDFLHASKHKSILIAESAGRCETLIDLLKLHQLHPTAVNDWQSALEHSAQLIITIGSLTQGFVSTSPSFIVITENELFGHATQQRRQRQSKAQPSTANLIQNLVELQEGSPVVHLEYGVGRYLGLQTIKTGKITGEFLTLEYANQDRIYVPISSLHLISRYTSANQGSVPLQRLGSQHWEKSKDKALKKIRDVAAELLDVYSQRELTTGFECKPPGSEYLRFREEFPFEETTDQSRAISAVIKDMVSARSMDRLICGDVGFGKTEVAMQSAFLAVMSDKQVAVLVPTTLLANQHQQNFCDRFANWPIKIGVLSRLQTKKDQQKVISALHLGLIDIVIGTHRLLSHDIHFKDLGLLVVDEEHRFGVRHKERIKGMRANVDILTLTATPIPRTLNMALSGTRDLSIIATPPQKRLKIKTFIHSYNSNIIKEAISREVLRGGQVFFCHNNINSMQAELQKINELCPEANSVIAHGQLPERQLERVMSDFYHQKYNVLIATTIIESGIDIPTANTIIINKAHCFGLAQLHQLRGRVGRSHHQAYAYLLTPERNALKNDAKKRLDAFSSLEDLGAGFTLATHDLEIRGAGELLGEEQSGHIHAIGFSLYMELLEKTVNALKNGQPIDSATVEKNTVVELGVTAILPESYIPDTDVRLTFYKRLAACPNKEQVSEIKVELIDRFGLLPPEAQPLFASTELKIRAQRMHIKKIEIKGQHGLISFQDNPNINTVKLIELIQQYPQQYTLKNATTLRLSFTDTSLEYKIDQTYKIMDAISTS